jgi:hypothetical protein
VLTAGDTIKAPLAAPFVPAAVVAAQRPVRWTREELFAAGALTLGELLAQVPGVTLMAAGFMLAPATLAWHGDPGAVRVFVDGVEREELTPRNGGVTDFALLPLWTLEHIALEETAGELRVHVRTWRVNRTTASTRTDVLTGSENLNLFRGYFGKRATNGLAIQVAAQQASTISLPGMDGDGLGSFARLGWAGGQWSVDATTLRQGLNRNVGARGLLTATPEASALPAFRGAASLSYLRLAWRDAAAEGAWLQAVAASVAAGESPAPSETRMSGDVPADSADTTASQAEYTIAGGMNRGSIRAHVSARARSRAGALEIGPLARAEYLGGWATLAAAAGRRPAGALVWDVRAAARLRPWLRAAATTGVTQASLGTDTRAGSTAELAIRWRDRWLAAGWRHLSAGPVRGPVELDSTVTAAQSPAGSALTVSATGPAWRGWRIATDVVKWDGASSYRPQLQARSRLWFASEFKERFPTANFHLLVALTHEYRSQLYVPRGDDPVAQATRAWSTFGTLLEIRIANAVLTWDYRDISGLQFETFPGYLMPRIASVYGIRWEFWN